MKGKFQLARSLFTHLLYQSVTPKQTWSKQRQKSAAAQCSFAFGVGWCEGRFASRNGGKRWSSGLKNITTKVPWVLSLKGYPLGAWVLPGLVCSPQTPALPLDRMESGEGSIPSHEPTPQPTQPIAAQPGLVPRAPGLISGIQWGQSEAGLVGALLLPARQNIISKRKKPFFFVRSSLLTHSDGYSSRAASLFQLCRMFCWEDNRQLHHWLLPLVYGCQHIRLPPLPPVWSRCCLAPDTIWNCMWSIRSTAIHSN